MPISASIYEALTNDEDTRLCREIGENACREVPQNFTLILLSYCLTKLGDAIANPKTTVAWLTSMVGAPAFVLGLIVPIRESGSMIPQLFIGGAIRRLPVRKWVWVAGSLGQAVCIAGLAVFAVSRFFPGLSNTLWFLPAAYFVLSLAHSGVRVGRKTYVVNLASGNKRTDYVAISNTVIGILLLLVGAVGALAPVVGNDGVIGLLALMGLAGAAYGTRLPNAEA